MALLRTPREAWVEAGLEALAHGGPHAVRVEVLAESLGVTKGGFYGQFRDRQELLAEMLNTWEALVIDEAIRRVEEAGGDARAKLRRLFTLASGAGKHFAEIELAIRDWARHDRAAARRLKRVDERRMAYMRSLFADLCEDEDEVEARCMLVLSLFVAGRLVHVGHRGRTRHEVLQRALRDLVA